MKTICVFCGSSSGAHEVYMHAAENLGRMIARAGLTLVYGGARVGLMGRTADSALSAGGRVVGVLPDFLAAREIAHAGLSELIVVRSMHERKAVMESRSDAFIALPGGLGTLEEIFEMLTWVQLGVHHKPCAFVNTAGYYDFLRAFLARASHDRFISPAYEEEIFFHEDPGIVLETVLSRPGRGRPSEKSDRM